MSLASVKAFFAENAPDIEVIELETSTATVMEAAAAHQVEPAQIAKTLSLKQGDDIILLVARGDARLDNRKFKDQFQTKPRMLELDAVLTATGHPVGGVCPFGLSSDIKIYCDVSIKAFDEVLPAAGATNSAVRINPHRMAELTNAVWVDVCQ